MSVILVCTGWRGAKDEHGPLVEWAFDQIAKQHGPIVLVVEGEEPRGIDRICREVAGFRRLPHLGIPADWRQGKPAGPRRNAAMAAWASSIAEARNLTVIGAAFPHPKSVGTLDMMKRIEALGWPLHVFPLGDKGQLSG